MMMVNVWEKGGRASGVNEQILGLSQGGSRVEVEKCVGGIKGQDTVQGEGSNIASVLCPIPFHVNEIKHV